MKRHGHWRRSLSVVLLLVFALPLWQLMLRAADTFPFPTPGATIVLLNGLPGDIESEKAYRDQLGTWLEVLGEQNPPAGTVHVFWHAEPPPELSEAKIVWHRATRAEFLSLGQELTGQTNSLLVIAWGHGGLQGADPVFHVRGPRLTPADFKTFAVAIPAATAEWVLMFRGSGRFAETLAGPRRSIVSSEGSTSFSNDPIGMPLLIKLAKAKTPIPFETLAAELGRATVAWYNDRQLARTEEPTLWQDGESRRLATETAATLASVSPPAAPRVPESLAAGPDAAGNTSTARPGPAWKGVNRVRAEDYEGYDGVLLSHRISFTLGENPALVAEHEVFLQVLTVEGKSYGDFDFDYSPPDEELSFTDCEVLQSDGTLLRLDPDEIRETGDESVAEYKTGRQKFFSLPGVGPGSVLHVRYQSEWKRYPLPHLSMEIPIAAEIPACDMVVEISLPKELTFHYVFEAMPGSDPETKQSTYGSTYRWRFRNLAPHEKEQLAPPGRAPSLLISTFPDWKWFSEWYTRISKLADEVTPEIAAKAAELTRDDMSDREKAKALYNYVTSLRYVAVPLGVNSFRPHAAANVFKNQFGDCKDKANLFNTLLHSLDIRADLVLVPRFDHAFESLPGFAFNHAISRVRLGDETVWVDTTDDICRFGMLPPGDPGRKVLVLDGKSTSLTQLPIPTPEEHQLTITAALDCSDPNKGVAAEVSLETRGYPDYELRSAAQDLASRVSRWPILAMRFHSVAGAYGFNQQTFTPVSDLETNFTWSGRGEWFGLGRAGDHAWQLRAPFWLPDEWELSLHARTAPLFLNQGYPLGLTQTIAFRLPKNTQDLQLPARRANEHPPLQWRIEWDKAAANEVKAHLQLQLTGGELNVEDTVKFQQQLGELVAALEGAAKFGVTD